MRLLISVLVLTGCASNSLPTYKCAKTIDGANETGGEVASLGSIAYVAGAQTIGVFDVSSPSDPKVLTPLAFPQRVEAIAASGNRLIAAGSQILYVFDATDPKAPVKFGEIATTTTSKNALATDGHWVYAGTPNGTVMVFDISAATPVYVTQSASGGTGQVSDLLLNGSVLYASGSVQSSLVAYDVSNPMQPVPKPAADMQGHVQGLVLADGVLFASTTQAPLEPRAQRIDISKPLEPKLVATSTDLCACGAPDVAVQITAAYGHVIMPLAQNRSIGGWPQGHIEQLYEPMIGGCIPDRYSLQQVYAIGESLIITGGDAIGFLAP